MGHQYGNAKAIEALQTDLNTAEAAIDAIESDLATVDLDVLAEITNTASFVDFTVTGANAGTEATAINAIITNLVAAGLMKAS